MTYTTLTLSHSAKFSPQRCGLEHVLEDEDVVQIVKLTVAEERKDRGYSQRVQAFWDHYHSTRKKNRK
jgi:hypothetical protein